MTISAASIEANGWVLRVTHSSGLGSFSSYTLDPNGTPALTLASNHAGFAPSAGTAAAVTAARNLVGTKPVRKPVKWNGPGTADIDAAVIDETDLGGGLVRVRIALSQHFYATDSTITLTAAAGWRSGEPAASIAVTNNSTVAAPVPIFRWADVPYQRQTAAGFEIGVVAFSHHPIGLAPLAGVKFTVTDGTNTKTYWATALSTSTKYGDALRGYFVSVDPTTATALTAGLLRCDAELYPWIGSMRSTDTAGTRSMTGLDTAAHAAGAAIPFAIAWDPAATRYAAGWVHVDPVNGTATAAAAMVQSTLAGAKAVTASAKAKDIPTALQAGYLANRTLAAANGQTSRTRSVDGLKIVVPPSNAVSPAGTAVTTGISARECWAEIIGDPDDGNPRANCIVRAQTANASSKAEKVVFRNLTIEQGGFYVTSSAYVWEDNVERRGKSGAESDSTTPTSSANLARYGTRHRSWKNGTGWKQASSSFPLLLRNVEASRTMAALAVLGAKWIAPIDSFAPSTGGDIIQLANWNSVPTNLGAHEDVIHINCDLRSGRSNAVTLNPADGSTAGVATVASYRRHVFANNLCERIGSTGQPFWIHDELSVTATRAYNIYEGNSFIGERNNTLYCRPAVTTLAEADSLVTYSFMNRVANNSFDWMATKHDDTFETGVATARGNNNGFAPIRIEVWSALYGVNFEGNYDWGRSGGGNFACQFYGLRGVQATAGVPGWTSDRSVIGTNAGGGSYKPAAGSALIGRARSGNIDQDLTGAVRTVPFASGALDTPLEVALVPAGALSATRAAASLVGWTAVLAATGGRSASLAAASLTGWRTGLTPAGAVLASRAAAGGVGWTTGLVPAASALASAAAVTATGWATGLAPNA